MPTFSNSCWFTSVCLEFGGSFVPLPRQQKLLTRCLRMPPRSTCLLCRALDDNMGGVPVKTFRVPQRQYSKIDVAFSAHIQKLDKIIILVFCTTITTIMTPVQRIRDLSASVFSLGFGSSDFPDRSENIKEAIAKDVAHAVSMVEADKASLASLTVSEAGKSLLVILVGRGF